MKFVHAHNKQCANGKYLYMQRHKMCLHWPHTHKGPYSKYSKEVLGHNMAAHVDRTKFQLFIIIAE